ncbi:type II secretion system F family protein [Flexivirga lutea]
MTAVYTGAGLIAIAIVIGVVLVTRSSDDSQTVARSLALIGGAPASDSKISPQSASLTDRIFTLTSVFARRLSPASAVSRLERSLDRAGRPAPWSVERVMGAKGASGIVGGVVGLLLGNGLSLSGLVLAVALAAVFFYGPDLLLYNTGLRRQEKIMRGFAEALDMLTICVEAGQGFDAALLEVARNANGPIAGELARMTAEIQIGTSRAEAFRALGVRVNQAEVKSFVTAIAQADQLGIPIASVLREQTAAMRVSRRQRAEAQAQKVTVKILFPLMFCIFPSLLVVIMGPAIIRIAQTFSRNGI